LKIRRSSSLILAASVAILLIALGLRASFGLFLQPMSVDNGWTRDVFSMAFAIQSIVWGLGAPVSSGRWRTAMGRAARSSLAVGFAGYLHPDMRLDWATIAQLCGLR
jgi:hypothetical protein